MTDDTMNRPDQRLVDIHALAGLVELSPEATRTAGRVFFARMASPEAEVGSALVHASAASGAEPSQIIAMIQLMASDFDRPLGSGKVSFQSRIQEIGGNVADRADRLFTDARDRIDDFDLTDAKRQVSGAAQAGRSLGNRALANAGEFIERMRDRVKKD